MIRLCSPVSFISGSRGYLDVISRALWEALVSGIFHKKSIGRANAH